MPQILRANSHSAGLILRVKSFPIKPTRQPGYLRYQQTDDRQTHRSTRPDL